MNIKRRILVLADSCTVSTGFATVSKNVLKELYDSGKYEIDMIGINYDGTFSKDEMENKYYYLNKLVPAHRMNSNDMYGREYALLALTGAFPEIRPPYDIFFTIQDHFILQAKSSQFKQSFAEGVRSLQENTLKSKYKENHFMWVGYYPIDGVIKKEWVDDCMAKTTFPVAYCNFGASEMLRFATKENKLKERLSIIRHGTNTKDFYPLAKEEIKEFRKRYFPMIEEDTFLIINVNRNQVRKDIVRTMLIYKEFKKKYTKCFLYLHCSPNDVGGNLYDIARGIGLEEKDFAVPKNFSPNKGISVEILNQIYNCADLVITTTLGEGWGLSLTEAMATKTPVLAPNITSIPEIFNTENDFDYKKARGIPMLAGINYSEILCYGELDNEVIRPITSVEDGVEKLEWIVSNPDKVEVIVENAYNYAKELTWENESKKWIKLFDEAIEVNDQLRKRGAIIGVGEDGNGKYALNGETPTKIGRNDLCPLCLQEGVKIKIKKCEKHKEHFI